MKAAGMSRGAVVSHVVQPRAGRLLVRLLVRLIRMRLSRWPAAAIPMLTYHSIADEPWGTLSRYRITRQLFARQMAFLSEAGFTTLPLEGIVGRFDATADLPATGVVLTFDDGYEDFYLNALPLLRRYRFSATVFVVTDFMGTRAVWLGSDAATPLMTWEQAREALGDGISFSSHSCTHPYLSRLVSRDVQNELIASRRVIIDKLGMDGVTFCYPHGDFDARVRSAVREAGYAAAVSTEIGLTTFAQDRYALRRVKIRPEDSMLDFAAKLVTGEAAGRAGWRALWRRRR